MKILILMILIAFVAGCQPTSKEFTNEFEGAVTRLRYNDYDLFGGNVINLTWNHKYKITNSQLLYKAKFVFDPTHTILRPDRHVQLASSFASIHQVVIKFLDSDGYEVDKASYNISESIFIERQEGGVEFIINGQLSIRDNLLRDTKSLKIEVGLIPGSSRYKYGDITPERDVVRSVKIGRYEWTNAYMGKKWSLDLFEDQTFKITGEDSIQGNFTYIGRGVLLNWSEESTSGSIVHKMKLNLTIEGNLLGKRDDNNYLRFAPIPLK
jgi:hypothetical protein